MGTHLHPRDIMTAKFYDDHVIMLHVANLSELPRYDLNKLAKKFVERKYVSRKDEIKEDEVAINTVLAIGIHELKMLASEVRQRQSEYRIKLAPIKDENGKFKVPKINFTSYQKYPHFARGTRGAAPSRKQRSTYLGLRRFKYGLIEVKGEGEPSYYKLFHYEPYLESD